MSSTMSHSWTRDLRGQVRGGLVQVGTDVAAHEGGEAAQFDLLAKRRVRGVEEFLDRGKCLDAQSYCSQEPAERVAYFRIVVDDHDNRLSLVIGHDHSSAGRRLSARSAPAGQADWRRRCELRQCRLRVGSIDGMYAGCWRASG